MGTRFKVLSEDPTRHLNEKVQDVFRNIVEPVFEELIKEYDGVNGCEVKIVPESPVIMGIERHSSIMFKHPIDIEMIVCVYWTVSSDKIVAENISMLTLNKTFNIFEVTKEELKKQVKFLGGMGS